MANNSGDQNTSGNSRWWESYLVRYFSGFLVGALCVSTFLAHIAFITAGAVQIEKVISTLLEKDSPTIAILSSIGILGLVYSYVVSAPITVMHFGRGIRIFWDAQARYFWLAWAVVLGLTITGTFEYHNWPSPLVPFVLISIMLCFLYWMFKQDSRLQKRGTNSTSPHLFLDMGVSIFVWIFITVLTLGLLISLMPPLNKWQLHLLVFSLPAIWVGISQYVTLIKVLVFEHEIHQFYQRLTKARGGGASREIRESYTHLREHSNSTFIVVLELCFYCLITLAVSINVTSQQTMDKFFATDGDGLRLSAWLFCIFMIWSIPNLFLWSRANSLERDFANWPNKY